MQSCQKMALTNAGYTDCLFHGQTMRIHLNLNGGKNLARKGSSWLQWDRAQLDTEPLQGGSLPNLG